MLLHTYTTSRVGVWSNYLDDFGGAEVWEKAEEAIVSSGTVIKDSGLEESVVKACGPDSTMVFLRIQFDTVKLTLSVTHEKLVEIIALLKKWELKSSATKKQVQQLIGKLNFVAKCVRPGRIFISRMLEFLRGLKNDGARLISSEFLKDVHWWTKFVSHYNGVSMMPMMDLSQPDEVLSSDACLGGGGGGWFDGNYFHCQFPDFIKNQGLHINALELLTVIVCVKLWRKYWKGQRIVIVCDNKVTVDVINAGRARDRFLLKCMRELVWLAASLEFQIRVKHIPGVTKRLPNLLCRWSLTYKAQEEFWRITNGIVRTEFYVTDKLFLVMTGNHPLFSRSATTKPS